MNGEENTKPSDKKSCSTWLLNAAKWGHGLAGSITRRSAQQCTFMVGRLEFEWGGLPFQCCVVLLCVDELVFELGCRWSRRWMRPVNSTDQSCWFQTPREPPERRVGIGWTQEEIPSLLLLKAELPRQPEWRERRTLILTQKPQIKLQRQQHHEEQNSMRA